MNKLDFNFGFLLLISCFVLLAPDISDTERPTTPPPSTTNPESESRQQALNYSTLAAAAVAANNVPNGQDPNLSSTETLLRNIQGLLKVAADNARQQERQIGFEKGKFSIYTINLQTYLFNQLIQSPYSYINNI